MRKLNYGQIDAENPGTTQGKKVPGALETLTGLENLQVTDTGGGIWRSVSHISWSKNSVLSLATAHSVSVYLFFQQRCAQSPCSGSQRSQKPQQGTTALGELGLRSGGGRPAESTKGGPCARSKGQSGKGPGEHLPPAFCVSKEEMVARRMKDIPGRMARGLGWGLAPGLLTPRPALCIPCCSWPPIMQTGLEDF